MLATKAYFWHDAPFLRLLVPLMAGIVVQWYFSFSIAALIALLIGSFIIALLHFFIPDTGKYLLRSLNGVSLNIFIAVAAACLVYLNDTRNDKNWFGYQTAGGNYLVVRLAEPLVEKQNSFKALSDVVSVVTNGQRQKATGKIIIYFKKDRTYTGLDYGSQIVFNKPMQVIRNSGNPGSFDYHQYCLLHGITHQVYLSENEIQLLPEKNKEAVDQFLFDIRKAVVNILRKFIKGEKEQGLAEALLIGYKDDLDKDLVESYSHTGVVHIIAISGLHLGLIYWLLLLVTKPVRNKKQLAWPALIIIVAGLWIFSLLAGGGPSVLRSAVMFSCIAIGKVWNKRSFTYNTLALSAFALLVWNPFWLWDVGFQLSYSAVLSIMIFFRPIYGWLYCSNKLLHAIWKLTAVTMAAQILTLPFSVYHFHQFPTLFLFANFLAVPLSSVILIGEIFLVAISSISLLAQGTGWLVQNLICCMNAYIERLDEVSFAVWNNLSISIIQTILLLGFVAAIGYWFIEKNKKAVWLSLFCLGGFFALRSLSFVEANNQKQLIVYNVPKHCAIDIIDGRSYWFIGDADLQDDDFIRNFHLQPARTLYRINPSEKAIAASKSFSIMNKKLLLLDSSVFFSKRTPKPVADVVILSRNPKLYINKLNEALAIKQVVIDGSVPAWKAELWKRDCDSLHLPCHDVSEKGAFVMNLQ